MIDGGGLAMKGKCKGMVRKSEGKDWRRKERGPRSMQWPVNFYPSGQLCKQHCSL